jgi:GGDEF domain-containing protein
MTDLDAELARTLVARLSGDLRARELRCSLGAAIFPKDAQDARGLVEAADRALYNTKAAGKNGYSFY